MKNLIGRTPEIKVLQEALTSNTAELVAVYGRRRVGKTHLVRTVYADNLMVELTGINNAPFTEQMENFTLTITRAFQLPISSFAPKTWLQAFHFLMDVLEPQLKGNAKKVVFLDELPWFDSHKSGFLSAFDHFWNTWASKQDNLVVVICGSAASWMIQNIVRNKGGLHNRITRRLRLMPFNLHETISFLESQMVDLDPYQILQLYMVTGGIPHYLKNVKRGESVTQAIDRMCFTHDGFLSDEFRDLYAALFGSSEKHELIVKTLANKPSGMTRNEIVEACQISSGGTLSILLEELLQSGFISEFTPQIKGSKESIYKLSDEFSLFYIKFMADGSTFGQGAWQSKTTTNAWKTWCGLAFESICHKHLPQIKKALGISGVYTKHSAWRHKANETGEQGTQIDLLIDRQDNCINLCEIKFSLTEYELDKKTAENLDLKKRIFLAQSNTKKTVFITMLTTFGVKENGHYFSTVHNQLTMNCLFEADR